MITFKRNLPNLQQKNWQFNGVCHNHLKQPLKEWRNPESWRDNTWQSLGLILSCNGWCLWWTPFNDHWTKNTPMFWLVQSAIHHCPMRPLEEAMTAQKQEHDPPKIWLSSESFTHTHMESWWLKQIVDAFVNRSNLYMTISKTCVQQIRYMTYIKYYSTIILYTYLCDIQSHSANGPWKKSLNCIFPTKYVIPKSLKFSHWPSN